MILRDLLDLASKEKRKKERVKAVQMFAVRVGLVAAAGVATGILLAPKSGKETREEIKKKTANTVETIKDSAVHAAQEVSNVINDVHGKTKGLKKDIKDGCQDELNKAVK